MIDKKSVLCWEDVEHDLYEENGYVFVVELDLYNQHLSYYCKEKEDEKEFYTFLGVDIYDAIEKFNEIIKV